jgi:hypothetical protein
MRALCGAIITAGALIGLGLTAIGLGQRFQALPYQQPEGTFHWVGLKNLETPFLVILVALLATLAIGMAVAFIGLAYHHHRRHHELLHEKERLSKAGSAI